MGYGQRDRAQSGRSPGDLCHGVAAATPERQGGRDELMATFAQVADTAATAGQRLSYS